MDKSLIIKEIKKHLNFNKDGELANYLGVSQNTISSWKSRNTINYDLIISKCDFINANWLLTGKGEMLKNSYSLDKTNSVNEPSIPYGLKKEENIENEFIAYLKKELEKKDYVITEKDKKIEQLNEEIKKLLKVNDTIQHKKTA